MWVLSGKRKCPLLLGKDFKGVRDPHGGREGGDAESVLNEQMFSSFCSELDFSTVFQQALNTAQTCFGVSV